MARKRTPTAAPAPSAERVDAAVRKGDYETALDVARRLVDRDAKPHAVELLRETLAKAAAHHLAANREKEYRTALDELNRRSDAVPVWRIRLAMLYASGGDLTTALELVEPIDDATLVGKLTARHADWAVNTRNRAALAEPLHAAYDAVLAAFQRYHAGKDDDAREMLNAIGLSSPLLDWKLLIRGLIAWSNRDDTRAVENFSRLNPDRLPHRLAAPIRAQIDPAFAATVSAVRTTEQYRALSAGGLTAKLRAIQKELTGKKKLAPAFKAAEAALPLLKAQAPDAVPRLANCFYHAIIRQGEQDDLARYRKLFGQANDDPSFNKLEAMVFEEIDQTEISLQRWSAYEGWLSTLPNGWTKPLADRARAMILQRMSELAVDLEGKADDPNLFDDFPGFFGAPSRRKAPKQKPVDPAVFLKRAIDLAPDWETPSRDLFTRAVQNGQPAEAERIARQFLDHNPKAVYFLNSLAALLLRQGRAAEAVELRTRSLKLNPLDAMTRHYAAAAHVAHARRLGIAGKPADAQAELDDHHDLVFAEMKPSYHSLRSVLFRKLGDKAKADEHAAAGLALPGARLTVRLYLHANAVLLKLKPADKTAAGKALTAALAEQPDPKEANMLLAGWDVFHHEGLTYTGQKTQEKKIYDVMMRAADGNGPEVEFEGLTVILNSRGQYTLVKKLAPKLIKRFPKNPVFPYCLGEAEANKSRGGYKVTEPLRKAKVLAESSTEERHRRLLPKIEQLLKEMNPFGALFGGFFGGDDF